MKKVLRIFIMLLAFSLIAAACSGDGDVATADDPVDIGMWIAFSDEARLGFTQDKAAAFNAAYPQYNVIVQEFDSYNSVFEQAVLAVDGGDPPAIIHFFEAATRQALDAVKQNGDPIFKSVTDAIDGRTEILGVPVVLNDVVSSPRNYYTVDGSFYSMPWNTSTTTMFTNTDMLDAAGVVGIPQTWDEVEAACELIMAVDDAPEACITWPNHSWFVEQALGQQGALLANADNGRDGRADEVFLTSHGMIDYVSWWKDMSDKGYYIYTGAQRDWTGTRNLFDAQEVAMLVYSSSDTTVITQAGVDLGFNVESSFMPRNGDVAYDGNLIGGATLWLLDGLTTAEEDGALAFMNFFSNPENAAEWHKITGYIPITQAAVDLLDSQGWYDESPNSKVASDQLDAASDSSAARGALLGNFVAIRDIITLAIEDILVNDLDVATRMDAANDEANKSLGEYEALNGG